MAGREYRLLIDIDVIEFLRGRPRIEQEGLLRHFRAIADSPGHYYDYVETDSVGRRLGVHVFSTYAIRFWEDSADMHVKILEIESAD